MHIWNLLSRKCIPLERKHHDSLMESWLTKRAAIIYDRFAILLTSSVLVRSQVDF